MKKCDKCGNENIDKAVFCSNCGEKYETIKRNHLTQAEEQAISEVNEKRMDEKKDGKLKQIIVLLLIALAVVGGIVLYSMEKIKEPSLKVLNGLINYTKSENLGIKGTMHFENIKIDDEIFSKDDLKKLESFTFAYGYAMTTEEYSVESSIKYGAFPFFAFDMAYLQDVLYLDLFGKDEVLYFEAYEFETIMNYISQGKKYYNELKLSDEIEYEKYGKVITKNLGSSLKKEDEKVILNVKTYKLLKALKGSLNLAKNDEKLLRSFHGEVIRILGKVLDENEYKTEVNEAIEQFLKENKEYQVFEVEAIHLIDDVIEEIEYMLELQYYESIDLEIVFNFKRDTLEAIDFVYANEFFDLVGQFDLTHRYNSKEYSIDQALPLEEEFEDEGDLFDKQIEHMVEKIKSNEEMRKDIETSSIYKSYLEYYNDSGNIDEFLKIIVKELSYSIDDILYY